MKLLNRLIARYGSADGEVVNNRRVAVAVPNATQQAAQLAFWFFRGNGQPISGVPNVTLVLVISGSVRAEYEFSLVNNRVDFGVDKDFASKGVYKAWFELHSTTTGYLRTEPFELHLLE